MFIICLILGVFLLVVGVASLLSKEVFYCPEWFLLSFLCFIFSVVFYSLEAPVSLTSENTYQLIEKQSGLYFANDDGEIQSLGDIDKRDIKYLESEEFKVIVKEYESSFNHKETKYEVYLNLDETDDLKEALSVKDPAYEVIMTNGSYYNETDNGYSIRYIEDSLVKEIEISKDNLKITKSDSGDAALVKINSQFEILVP